MPVIILPFTLAFIAGIVSFVSPCVLPLIPGYLIYLSGVGVGEETRKRGIIFLNSIFFVLGFSMVFALVGVLLNTLVAAVAYEVQSWLARLGGALIIFFGLYIMGLLKIPWLSQEHRLKPSLRFHSRYVTSFLFGAAFAAGWTPCVGAVLGSILTLALSHPAASFTLLMAYALGLGLPFLLVGLFTIPATHLITRYARWGSLINKLFGALLIFIGILIFTENISQLSNLELLNRYLLR